MTSEYGRIDVHHHILPMEYIDSLKSIGIEKSAGIPFPKWTIEDSLEMMNNLGIRTSIVSISAPGVYFGDIKFANSLSRKCNELFSLLIDSHPNRFGAFAILPLPDIESSINQLEYALDTLKLDGVGLLSNIDNLYLGDHKLDPILSELNIRKTVVFVHPNTSPPSMLPKIKVPSAIMEFVFNTTRAIANMVYNRTFKRFPNIKFIFPHAGGTVPFLAWRISMGEKRIIRSLKNLYYDVALNSTKFALPSLQELANTSNILFGSDYPFFPKPLIEMMIKNLEIYEGFDNETKLEINYNNALDLFPRFK